MGKKRWEPSPRLQLAARLQGTGALVSDREKEELRQKMRRQGLSVPMSEFLGRRYPVRK